MALIFAQVMGDFFKIVACITGE